MKEDEEKDAKDKERRNWFWKSLIKMRSYLESCIIFLSQALKK